MPLVQLDVKNVFVKGDLKEEVYLDIPPGLNSENNKQKPMVCKLRKSLYGLKQSPRAWFKRFTLAILKYSFIQTQSDHTLFIRFSDSTTCTILVVYVDDIILTSNDHKGIDQIKRQLSIEFEVKDIGSLRYFLGMEVARTSNDLCISQRKYILDLLNETGMLECKPAVTPLESGYKPKESCDNTPTDRLRYQQLAGKLIYLSHTRPDICYAVSFISQFMHNPTDEHLKAALRVLRYLKAPPAQGLSFTKNMDRQLIVYTDADWTGSRIDMHLQLIMAPFYGGI